MKDPLANRVVAIVFAVSLLVAFAVFLTLSWALGAPDDLPGIALGSPAIVHLLRAALVTALLGGVALLLLRGAFGHWPREAGGVKYAAETVQDLTRYDDALQIVRLVLTQHGERLEQLDEYNAQHEDRLDELEARP
jgi:hypothetical protein